MSSISAGALISDRYEVVKTLKGGMGVVFLCLDRVDDLPVALKTFKPEYLSNRAARDRFLREGATWVELGRHRHVVHAYRVESTGEGGVFIVLEWVAQAEGKRDASLRAWLTPGKPLPNEQALRFALHIARGMKHATTKKPGLVHRDLKPENLLVDRDGYARVTDFGLAKTLDELSEDPLKSDDAEVSLVRTHLTHGVVGTPLYMAPEQWAAEPLDARVDIYAFGCIAYEMLTGRLAVSGTNAGELEQAHRAGRVRDMPPEVSGDLSQMIHRCMEVSREARYSNWQEVEAAVALTYHNLTGLDETVEMMGESETRAERLALGGSYGTIAIAYADIGKYDLAMNYLERALQIGEAENDQSLQNASLFNKGIVYRILGQTHRAIEYFNQARAHGIDSGSRIAEVTAIDELGNAHRDLGDLRSAIEFYDKALVIARELGERSLEGQILGNMGTAYRQMGDPRRAIQLFGEALGIARDIGDRTIQGPILGNIGNAYRNLNDPQRAIQYHEQALALARALGDRSREGHSLGNLGNAFATLGDWTRAIYMLEQALAIAREIKDRRAEGTFVGNLGAAYVGLDEPQQAIQYFEQAVAIARELGDVLVASNNSYNLSTIFSEQRQPEKALRYAEEAAQGFTQVGHAVMLRTTKKLIAQIRRQIK